MKRTSAAVVIVLPLLFAAAARGEIKKCVGPGGETVIVNTECPAGYRVEHAIPASEPSSAEPYICRFADILSTAEIEGALAEASGSVTEARSRRDGKAEQYWAKCLEDLRRRQQSLHSRDQGIPAPATERVEERPPPCAEGEFEYKEGAVFFASSRRGACQGLRAQCTFDVRTTQRVVSTGGRRPVDRLRGDDYVSSTSQQILNFNFSGSISKFGTARLGDVNVTGRVTNWTCRILD